MFYKVRTRLLLASAQKHSSDITQYGMPLNLLRRERESQVALVGSWGVREKGFNLEKREGLYLIVLKGVIPPNADWGISKIDPRKEITACSTTISNSRIFSGQEYPRKRGKSDLSSFPSLTLSFKSAILFL